jgi:hypothetical protein
VGLVFLSIFRGAGKLLKAVKEIDLWSEPPEEAEISHKHTHGMLQMVFPLLSSSGLNCGWLNTAAFGCKTEKLLHLQSSQSQHLLKWLRLSTSLLKVGGVLIVSVQR